MVYLLLVQKDIREYFLLRVKIILNHIINLILIFFSYSIVVRNEDYFGFNQLLYKKILFFNSSTKTEIEICIIQKPKPNISV